MRRNLKLRFALIGALVLASVWYLVPTFRLYALSADERRELARTDPARAQDLKENAIKLGLDLQGGMHLVLEIDESERALSRDDKRRAIDQILEVIRNRVNQFGVAEPLIQKVGEDRIIVELPGVEDEERAKSLVEQAAFLEFQLVREGREATSVIRRLDSALASARSRRESPVPAGDTTVVAPAAARDTVGVDAVPPAPVSDTAGSEDAETIEALIRGDSGTSADSGAAAADVARTGTFSTVVQADPGGSGDLVVREDLVPIVKGWLSMPSVRAAVPSTAEILWSSERRTFSDGESYVLLYVTDRKPLMTGEAIATANAGFDPQFQNRSIVSLTMTGDGRRLFGRVTGAHVNDRLAIVLDGVVRMAPNIQQRIPDGRAQITGFDSPDEANVISIVLQAGALQAPVRIIEERTIGASLGADSVANGQRAFILGSLAVVLFMFLYYRLSGAVANFALLLNVLFLLAVLAAIDATLTLPGIAGVILTVGMAVDANVLIFERVREELARGKSVRAAIDTGYDLAFTTIVDSNLTTLIVGLVLLQFGTGPVKGFGITLCIGIAISMFTAIFVTRSIFEAWLQNRAVERLSI
ncbi:MAG: protein translocase subunit SecD [Gemmatimonadetes bacterium]|nr:protein translocase subunit SecD [Gemmatimonadota bacterium]